MSSTATTDGQHILGATLSGGGIELSDIGVTIPRRRLPGGGCQRAAAAHHCAHASITVPVNVNATVVNQVVASPASNLAFITYDGTTQPARPCPTTFRAPAVARGRFITSR